MPDPAGAIRPVALPPLRLYPTAQTWQPDLVKSTSSPFIPGPRSIQRQGILFSPFSTKDAIKLAAAVNVQRMAAHKAARPLIAASPQQYALLETARLAYVAHCTEKAARATIAIAAEKELSCPQARRDSIDQFFNSRTLSLAANVIKWQARREAAKALAIFSNTGQKNISSLRPESHKLYILCHGTPGNDSVTSSGDRQPDATMGSQQLALMLKSAGLRSSFTDIRVISCNSADARAPKSFDAAELSACAQPGVKRVAGKPVLTMAFAQRLSLALSDIGYTAPSVAGYHARGCVNYLFRCRHGASTIAGVPPVARRSAMRARFGPQPSLTAASAQNVDTPASKAEPAGHKANKADSDALQSKTARQTTNRPTYTG